MSNNSQLRGSSWPRAIVLLVSLQFCANAGVRPSLPPPLVQFPLGRVDFHWTDSRPEPLSPLPRAHRELVVSVWYPAEAGRHSGPEALYYPGAGIIDESSARRSLAESYGKAWPFILRGELRTDATENAPVSRAVGRYPVLVFSHGYGTSGFQYTAMIETLASHGFIVVVVEHTFESAPILLTENKIAGLSSLSSVHYAPPGAGIGYIQALANVFAWELERGNVWAADIRFVLDRLTALDQQKNGVFENRLDLNRIGALGHSIGGRFTIRMCQLDQRIRACASLDGSSLKGQYLPYADATPPTQPLLFLSEHGSDPPLPPLSDEQLKAMHATREEFDRVTEEGKAASERQLRNCPKKCYVVDVTEAGMTHMSYSDIPLLSAYDSPSKEEQARQCLTDLSNVVVSFFGRVLQAPATSSPGVTGNSAPSITVVTYGQE